MGKIEKRLHEMGIELPSCPIPVAAYVPACKAGNLIYVSGQLPVVDGELLYTGKVDKDLSIEDANKAACICAIRCISVLKSMADLNCIRIIKVNGYVNSVNGFDAQSKVINGASELFQAVFLEKGEHARAAVGVSGLPNNAAVEVECIAVQE